MTQFLEGLQGVLCNMDDVLIYGSTPEEHHKRFRNVLQRLQDRGMILNAEKCEFFIKQVKFLENIIDQEGIRPDPNKIRAIVDMKVPSNVSELRSFLGMVNYLTKFVPGMSEIAYPLNRLLSTKNKWIWTSEQQESFDKLKNALRRSPVLAHYDPGKHRLMLHCMG